MPSSYIRLPHGYTNCKEYADALINFIERYNFVWKYHAVDILLRGYWSSFPLEWQSLITNTTHEDLIQLATYGKIKVSFCLIQCTLLFIRIP